MFRNIKYYLNLTQQLDSFENIHSSIEKDIVFKGTNLWILMLATFVASLGLNVNSTAVIIGAMLISPLMGPINGMGYSIATYNSILFRRAVKNFSFAVLASLVTSTLYFFLTPLSKAHSELLARTSPNIYDVLIALFGGLAGMVAISSKQKGNVIPGVAIATALMPPLCTAGYGLGTGQTAFFFGAFYLFTINTVFIALGALIVSQILKFPITNHIAVAKRKRINNWMSAVILITLIPSIYFGFVLVQQERFTENANQLISKINVLNGNYLLKSQIDANKRRIELTYGGKPLTALEQEKVRDEMKKLSLHKTTVSFRQGLAFNNNINITEIELLRTEINKLKALQQENIKIIDSLNHMQAIEKQILVDLHKKYPQIVSCQIDTKHTIANDTLLTQTPFVNIQTNRKKLKNSDRANIKDYLKQMLKSDAVKVFYHLP